MDWQDYGTILSARPHGESSMIVELFASAHGRHAGVVRGGASRKMAGMLQPGNRVMATWRARLEDHLGSFTLEPLQSRAVILSDRQALAGLNAATALLRFTLPEREPHDALFAASEALFDAMAEGGDWVPLYLRWELGLLEEMGYGLDLSSCAVTGSRDDLAYVSPRSGRAVSRAGAGEWAPKLLPLPLCLLGQGPASLAEIVQGLRLTGFFLGERMAPDLGDRPLPEARQRFVDLLGRSAR
ncbi:MAG: DNA repair protein RecO [Thioclava marina]|jgi:DNA repair protein RecO|uniref:DNA repair protein RecO n=1 Tax=Thioclava marina TaxID=1915077 RepID=A0ABX3MQ38_9RHOB|nr:MULTISPECIES: DNA repair protein RecO [Thioclava]TNE94277.1 MAG: DNA repair protein RecO [Paracoccaceae bacterium]MBC7144487.1 DNA repair protein RecO [Thioclava marina]MBD3802116.1 DNA repair protein RecO [Thioclava sp.]OOY13664.1 DNA repair protein RecO [Thioclava marina]OOY29372.1 DNA repair protein RecO [Thioclava sp. L04-15]